MKRDRLDRLVSLREKLHRQAQGELASARLRLANAHAALEEIDASVVTCADHHKGLADELRTLARPSLTRSVVAASTERERLRQRERDLSLEHKQVERLQQRRTERQRIALRRAEQKRLDDWASTRWGRKS